jgi:hypothetical protein
MKATALIVLGCFWLAGRAGAAEGQPPRVAVELTDGSRVVGASRQEAIRIQNELGRLQVSLRLIDQVRWKADREHVVVELANGDRITGAIIPEVMRLETLFGEASIPMHHVVLLKAMPVPLAGVPMLEGLILYAPFDEQPQAGKVLSRVGEVQGANRGALWVRDGQRGGAFQFTAADQAILVPDQELLRPKQLTISVWVKSNQAFAGSSYRGILAKTSPGNWTGGFGLACFPGRPDVHFFVNYYGAATAHAPIPDNMWTHLAGTYDERTLTLYINGKPAASAHAQRSYSGPIQHTSAPLLIGQAPDGYGWFGLIDEVMLFDRALTAADIERLYQLTRGD